MTAPRLFFALATNALLCLSAISASAEPGRTSRYTQQLYSSLTMQDAGETLDLLGLPYHAEAVNSGGVVANTRLVVADGLVWFMYGYNCQGRIESCPELQLRAVITPEQTTQEPSWDLDYWNRQNRFVRAYQSGSGKAVILEMDIYLAGGVALTNITDQILLWRQSLREFALYLKIP
ncbi:MAG: hypothetical protein COA47_12085 [Robiginitomaculum sp.]|nr:MAG: hypothetical protein COA47_12085 [Robiginitomaculum sp.]